MQQAKKLITKSTAKNKFLKPANSIDAPNKESVMYQILSHTPAFVFVLFFVLLVFGFLQTRDRKIKAQAAFIMPILMIFLSAAGLNSSFGFNPMSVGLWLGGLLIASYIFYKIFPLKSALYFPVEDKLFIPGDWVPFVVIMAIFFTKYAVGVMVGMGSAAVHEAGFIICLSFIYGCFSGYFSARALRLYAVKKANVKSV